MAALKRVLRLASLRASSAYLTSSLPSSSIHRFECRQFSQFVKLNGTRACLTDNLALVKRLEAQGVPSKQAEAIISAIIESSQTKELWGDIDKMRSELKHEIDKATAKQRLNLYPERGRTLDELANRNAEITNLTKQLEGISNPSKTSFVIFKINLNAKDLERFNFRGSKCPKGNFWLAGVMVIIFLGFLLGIAFKSVL